jgi:hypothetical protein
MFFLVMFLAGCTILAEKSGQLLEGSLFAAKTLERYRTADASMLLRKLRYRDGTEGWALTLESWPTLQFSFITEKNPPPENTQTLYPVFCSFLCSTYSGWNEFTMELTGTGTIRTGDTELSSSLVFKLNSIEAAGISEGRIRRGDIRLSGQEALTALRNRLERIEVLTAWMKDSGPPVSNHGTPVSVPEFGSPDDFETFWKPVLFPELVSLKKRPALYSAVNVQWERGEDIRWNTNYSAAVFPESLRPLRDSGTMLRDWEETMLWIYLVYTWDDIVQLLLTERNFVKTSK